MKHETLELLRFLKSFKRKLKEAIDSLDVEINGIEYFIEHQNVNRIKIKIEKLIEEEFDVFYSYNSDEIRDFNTFFINFDENNFKFFILKNDEHFEINKEGMEKFIDSIADKYLDGKEIINASPPPEKPKNIIERIFTFSMLR